MPDMHTMAEYCSIYMQTLAGRMEGGLLTVGAGFDGNRRVFSGAVSAAAPRPKKQAAHKRTSPASARATAGALRFVINFGSD